MSEEKRLLELTEDDYSLIRVVLKRQLNLKHPDYDANSLFMRLPTHFSQLPPASLLPSESGRKGGQSTSAAKAAAARENAKKGGRPRTVVRVPKYSLIQFKPESPLFPDLCVIRVVDKKGETSALYDVSGNLIYTAHDEPDPGPEGKYWHHITALNSTDWFYVVQEAEETADKVKHNS